MRAIRNNGIAIFFGVIFLATLAGQAVAGHAKYNDEEITHARLNHEPAQTYSLGRYVTSSSYARAVAENWQSEYLQFSLFILATIWLVQRGSTETKPLGKEGLESDEDQKTGDHADSSSPRWARVGGIRTAIYSNSLLIVMTLIFFGSLFAQSATGWTEYNQTQTEHKESTVSYKQYLGTSDFWEAALQNWQSEFLAIGSMAVFTIYLRQRGSQQSKPVGAAHTDTAV
jgi:hypothetical protein